jgi:hypothetical protein
MALETGRGLVRADFVADRGQAQEGLRRGRYRGVWVLPFGLSPTGPAPSFIGDNTDRFSFDTVEQALRQVWAEVSAPPDATPTAQGVRLEAYPYLDYLTYLGPAVVCLAIFMGTTRGISSRRSRRARSSWETSSRERSSRRSRDSSCSAASSS